MPISSTPGKQDLRQYGSSTSQWEHFEPKAGVVCAKALGIGGRTYNSVWELTSSQSPQGEGIPHFAARTFLLHGTVP